MQKRTQFSAVPKKSHPFSKKNKLCVTVDLNDNTLSVEVFVNEMKMYIFLFCFLIACYFFFRRCCPSTVSVTTEVSFSQAPNVDSIEPVLNDFFFSPLLSLYDNLQVPSLNWSLTRPCGQILPPPYSCHLFLSNAVVPVTHGDRASPVHSSPVLLIIPCS